MNACGMNHLSRDLIRALPLCSSALLEQGRTLDRLSRLLTVAGLMAALLAVMIAPGAAGGVAATGLVTAIAGCVEIYLAVRVGFDAVLFQRLGASPDLLSVDGMDAALTELELLPEAKRGRPIAARIAGARRLFRWQWCAVLAQVAAIVAGSAWMWGRR